MINKNICTKVLEKAMSSGADFAEIYCEDTIADDIKMLNSKVDNCVTNRVKGVGIRIFKGIRSIYAYGNDTTEKGLLTLAEKVSAALGNSNNLPLDIVLNETTINSIHPIKIPLTEENTKRKIDFIKEAYFAAKDHSNEIAQVTASVKNSYKEVLIANSEGLYVSDERSYIRFMVESVASDSKENQSVHETPGAYCGLEFLDTLNPKELGLSSAKKAITMLNAKDCPAGRMPVVIGNGFGGVIFHEACGHSLEATSVAKGNSVFCGKIGEQIANTKVTAIDDGTLLNKWGSVNISDEGEPTRRNVLIENGILKGYLIDKLNARRMNMSSTGSGRRQDYTFAPTSRMTNTYIDKGTDKFEDMIKSIDNGLYTSSMGGGSVNPVTGEFNFAVTEGYMIKNGEISEPVRGATLIGKGSEILMNIDMVSDDLSHAEGMCGSLSGSVPTCVGQPPLRVSEITVGGK